MTTSNPWARPPAVAGRFYPGSPPQLTADVRRYLAQPAPRGEPEVSTDLRALVVPHAGYVYSGPTAGVAYRLLAPRRDRIQRIVLLGPPHYVPVAGVALSSAAAWRTPLGEAPIDTGAGKAFLAHGRDADWADLPVVVDDYAHEPEHSLEVQLPFLQTVLPGVPVCPVLVGTSNTDALAVLLASTWSDPGALLVVSTDLSHYHSDPVARRLDARTAEAIHQGDADAIADEDACGARALRGVLRLAANNGARVRVLDLSTSADTVGDTHRVVGYGAFAVDMSAPEPTEV
ncbi:MAG: AmmeMemoRadiSam system protein B [Actinomycetes bacterium]